MGVCAFDQDARVSICRMSDMQNQHVGFRVAEAMVPTMLFDSIGVFWSLWCWLWRSLARCTVLPAAAAAAAAPDALT